MDCWVTPVCCLLHSVKNKWPPWNIAYSWLRECLWNAWWWRRLRRTESFRWRMTSCIRSSRYWSTSRPRGTCQRDVGPNVDAASHYGQRRRKLRRSSDSVYRWAENCSTTVACGQQRQNNQLRLLCRCIEPNGKCFQKPYLVLLISTFQGLP